MFSDMGSTAKTCLKACLISINILILLMGVAALGVGIWILVDDYSFFSNYPEIIDASNINKEFLRQAAIVLATGGAATVFFAGLGITAAGTGSNCLLGLYIAVIAVLIAVEVSAVILGIVFKQAWERELDNQMTASLKTKYDGREHVSDNIFTRAMSVLQQNQHCCGWINGSDYDMTGSQWNRTQANGTTAVVPLSCCKKDANDTFTSCTVVPTTENSNLNQGCKWTVHKMFMNYQGCIIGFGASILGFEFLMLILAIFFIANNNPNKYDMS